MRVTSAAVCQFSVSTVLVTLMYALDSWKYSKYRDIAKVNSKPLF